jgi:hypothetical protein
MWHGVLLQVSWQKHLPVAALESHEGLGFFSCGAEAWKLWLFLPIGFANDERQAGLCDVDLVNFGEHDVDLHMAHKPTHQSLIMQSN